jgi:DNA-binding IclR family transcriptional regulator
VENRSPVPAPPAPAYPIGSVDNALRLLLMFKEQRQVRVSEAARSIGVARSTAHRLLAMLQHHGFVQQDQATRSYVAGPALVDVGLSVVRDMDIRSQARGHLEALALETGETVHLVVLQGAQVLFVDCVESTKHLRVGNRTGSLLPAHCTSAGKALLADLPLERFRELYPAGRMRGLTTNSITSRALLEKQLEQVRVRGYASNVGEAEDEIGSVGVAIRDPLGRDRAALSVAAPLARLTDSEIPGFVEGARATAAAIGRDLA